MDNLVGTFSKAFATPRSSLCLEDLCVDRRIVLSRIFKSGMERYGLEWSGSG